MSQAEPLDEQGFLGFRVPYGCPRRWDSPADAWLEGKPEHFIPDEVGHRLAALTDGEGCFSLAANHCAFIIKMRADDAPFLERMRSSVGSPGRLRVDKASGGGNRKPSIRWTISTRKEVVWLTEVFDFYPLWSKKARDYGIWREAAIAWFSGGTHELAEYAKQIKAIRAYDPELATTYEEAEAA